MISIPAFATPFGAALLLLLFWLRPPTRVSYLLTLGGCLLLMLNVVALGILSIHNPILIFLIGFFEGLIAIVFGLSLALLSRRRRRLVGVALAVLYPLATYVGWSIGESQSTENIRRERGQQIAQALIAFRADHGEYPFVLDELVPAYLPGIVQPGTLWGWLYLRQADDFSLAYAWHIDRDGYSLQTITSALTWEFQLPFTTPFDLPPTPFSRPLSNLS